MEAIQPFLPVVPGNRTDELHEPGAVEGEVLRVKEVTAAEDVNQEPSPQGRTEGVHVAEKVVHRRSDLGHRHPGVIDVLM